MKARTRRVSPVRYRQHHDAWRVNSRGQPHFAGFG